MSCKYGLLIDYEFCTGCHACEVACRKALDLGSGQFGIKLLQDGPRELPGDKWEYNYLAMPTSLCDLCEERTSMGKPPSCVQHCPGRCIQFDEIEALAKIAAGKNNRALFVPYES